LRPRRFENSAPHLCFARLFAGSYRGVDRAANDTGVSILGVADYAGLVDFFAGKADIGGSRLGVPVQNASAGTILPGCNLSALLSCIIFVGEPTLGLRA
jgi:hypothetical protein